MEIIIKTYVTSTKEVREEKKICKKGRKGRRKGGEKTKRPRTKGDSNNMIERGKKKKGRQNIERKRKKKRKGNEGSN